MQRIGLYHPYFHFRDEEWMKAAALYWPRMARVVPAGFTPGDSGIALALKDELDFLVDVDPAAAAGVVSPVFQQLLRDHSRRLEDLYGGQLANRGVVQPGSLPMMREDAYDLLLHPCRRISGSDPGPELVALHENEVTSDLIRSLVALELGEVGVTSTQASASRDTDRRQGAADRWVLVDPRIAWSYKCLLTDELARRTGFVPTTDQAAAHSGSGSWDAEQLAAVLLGDTPPSGGSQSSATPDGQMVSAVGPLAVKCVLPGGLRSIPIEKIIQLRTRHAAEFDAFTDAVAATASELRDTLASIEDQTALQEYLRLAARQRFETPLAELQGAMKGLKIATGYSVIGYKIELGTATAASLGGLAVGSSLLTAGALAFGVASVRRANAESRDAHLRNSGAAFLLRLHYGLPPRSLVRRALRGAARATGTGI
ncbi:DUF6236 family protein [Streptomyces sp. DSM 118878]